MIKNLLIAFMSASLVLLFVAAGTRLRSIERELARVLHDKRVCQMKLEGKSYP